MRILSLAALTLIWGLILGPAASSAQQASADPDHIAAGLPVDIPEVHTGGSWKADGAQGVYRMVVVTQAKEAIARVYVQWIALAADKPAGTIVKSVPIKEVTDKRLPNAFVNFEVEKADELLIVVASYDPSTSKESVMAFRAGKPGAYEVTELPQGLGSGAPAEPARK